MTRLLVDMNLSVEWISLLTAAGPIVLQVRCLNVLPEAIGPLALELLRAYANEIEQGALVVADERRERVRILPLSTA